MNASAYGLAETIVGLLQDSMKTNIATTLANVKELRPGGLVTLEVPKEYFIYNVANVYRCPAVFTIIQDQNIRDNVEKANFINSNCTVLVAVVVEDRTGAGVTKKAWRYQAALMPILHQVSLTNIDGTVRIFSRVSNCQFSGVIHLKDEKSAEAVFRKEVSLKLIVEHIENLQTIAGDNS